MLTLTAVTKRFGATTALHGASLVVRRRTVHALLGENGAGKTTLMRIAFGMLTPDAGVVEVDGLPRHFSSPADAISAGVGMVHQHFTLVPAMTVTENVALGGRGRYDEARVREQIRSVEERTGLTVDPSAVVRDLPVAAQQRAEIVKALARSAKLLILDEPTAVLSPGESRELLRAMRVFVSTGGTVVLITHKLRDALEFADDVTVLRRGESVLTDRADRVHERTLAAAMIGAEPTGGLPWEEGGTGWQTGRSVAPGTRRVRDGSAPDDRPSSERVEASRPVPRLVPRLVLRDVAARDARGVERLRGANLEVRGGEIVGVAAVEGNGQHELLRVLARRIPVTRGDVEGPEEVGFVPEDRLRDALVPEFTLYENVALLGAGRRRGTVCWRDVRRRTAELLLAYDVRAPGPRARARDLSGGNQQKLVVGREIDGAPQALVVENPTRGLDVRATAAVHRRLRDARDRGVAVVVYSGDLDEVLELADRVIVLYDGTVRDVPRDRDVIGRAMVGAP